MAARIESGFALYVSSITIAPETARNATSRPATARKLSSPRTTAAIGNRAASAAAVAASALHAMCWPGTRNSTCALPA